MGLPFQAELRIEEEMAAKYWLALRVVVKAAMPMRSWKASWWISPITSIWKRSCSNHEGKPIITSPAASLAISTILYHHHRIHRCRAQPSRHPYCGISPILNALNSSCGRADPQLRSPQAGAATQNPGPEFHRRQYMDKLLRRLIDDDVDDYRSTSRTLARSEPTAPIEQVVIVVVN